MCCRLPCPTLTSVSVASRRGRCGRGSTLCCRGSRTTCLSLRQTHHPASCALPAPWCICCGLFLRTRSGTGGALGATGARKIMRNGLCLTNAAVTGQLFTDRLVEMLNRFDGALFQRSAVQVLGQINPDLRTREFRGRTTVPAVAVVFRRRVRLVVQLSNQFQMGDYARACWHRSFRGSRLGSRRR